MYRNASLTLPDRDTYRSFEDICPSIAV